MFHYNCVCCFYFYVFSINTDVLYTEYFADDDQQVRDMNPARVGIFHDSLTEHWRSKYDEKDHEWMLTVVYFLRRKESDARDDSPTKTAT